MAYSAHILLAALAYLSVADSGGGSLGSKESPLCSLKFGIHTKTNWAQLVCIYLVHFCF